MARRTQLVALACAVAALPSLAGAQGGTDPTLRRAYDYLRNGDYGAAQRLSQQYLNSHPPRYDAAFIHAAALCGDDRNSPDGRHELQALNRDYVLNPKARGDVSQWLNYCKPPPPPERTTENGVGSSGDALSMTPSVASAAPDAPEPTASARTQPAYGVDTCQQGFVWREAVKNDRVCVTPATRAQAARDNAAGPSRRSGGGTYGPDTCQEGFVWREATPTDHVCVTPEVRTQTAQDNRARSARLVLR
jgi:hypothetical protein